MPFAQECFLEEDEETVVLCQECRDAYPDDEVSNCKTVRVTEHDMCYSCGNPFDVDVE